MLWLTELGAELVKAGQKKVIVVDFRGPDKYWSPFADWLADQFSLALKTATSSLRVVDRAKLEEFEPIEVDESSVCASTIRAALELGVDTIVEGDLPARGKWSRSESKCPSRHWSR